MWVLNLVEMYTVYRSMQTRVHSTEIRISQCERATHRFEQSLEVRAPEVEAVAQCGHLRHASRLELVREILGEQRVHVARVGRRRGEHFGHEAERQVLREETRRSTRRSVHAHSTG